MLLPNNYLKFFSTIFLYWINIIMNYDKITYLFWSGVVLVLILGTSVLSNYGKSFIDDNTFKMFFSWFIALVLINLFVLKCEISRLSN